MKVPQEILNDVADSMEAGLKCYIHKESNEVVSFPDPDRFYDMEDIAWKEERRKIRKERKKFIEIEMMSSSQSFRVMEEFIDSLPVGPTKSRLMQAIEGHKPFANFNHLIHQSDERQMWFDFRRAKNIEWIRMQMEEE